MTQNKIENLQYTTRKNIRISLHKYNFFKCLSYLDFWIPDIPAIENLSQNSHPRMKNIDLGKVRN